MSAVSATQTIQQTNAAYLAQMKAAQSRKTAGAAPVSSSFASSITAVQPAAPTPLVAATAAPPPAAAEKAADVQNGAAVTETTRAAPIDPTSPEAATHVPYEDDALGFDDLVDLLNPLHHIPIVGSIYRAITDDTIKPDVQVAGSIAFGLATGSVLLAAASGIASAVFEQHTGEEPTVQLARSLFGDDDTVQVANAPPAPDAAQALEEETTLLAQKAAAGPAQTPAQTADAAAYSAIAGRESAPFFAQTGGMRVGNVIYAEPQVRSAARIAAPLGSQTLGAMIHEQAAAKGAGQSLPPELVQDMMLRAMDKYASAQNVAQQDEAETTLIP